VGQLSLNQRAGPTSHYELGRELRGLRRKGVLILGSGNIVHNLREMAWEDTAYDWALAFDERMKGLILSGDHEAIIGYSKLGHSARLAVPTAEHYLPLLYVLGAQDESDSVAFFAEKVTLARIFHTPMETPTPRRVRARGLQARITAPVGRVPSRGARGCEISGLGSMSMRSVRIG